jgi:hypothetical protein
MTHRPSVLRTLSLTALLCLATTLAPALPRAGEKEEAPNPAPAADKEIVPTDTEVLAMARAQEGERWYGIYVLGKKVGWQQDRWLLADDRLCNESEFTLKLAFLGKVSMITSREKTCYANTPPFAALSYTSTRNEDGRVITIEGAREEQELVYRITAGTRTRTSRVPLDNDLLADAVGWAPIARERIRSRHFDELTGKLQWQRFTLQGTEEKSLRGKPQKIFKMLIEDEAGMKLDALITREGVILEGAMGPSIRIVLEDKQTALRNDLALLDLYSTSFIPAEGDIDYARVTRVKHFELKLSGEGPLELATNGRQKILERGEGFVRIEVDACTHQAPAATPELTPFVACNADIPCDEEDVVKLAQEESKGASAPLDKARALARWVNRNFQYSLASGGGTGDQILAAKKGDCTEFAKALITLLRAAKIPARHLSGIVLASDTPPSFGYHAWVEAWIDGLGWVALDPTWGHDPVDATHIVFDVDEGLQMAAHLGGLTIQVVEVRYDEGEKGGITCD